MLFMTVPTSGNRSHLLENLVRDSGLPPDRVIVVTTRSNAQVPSGVVSISDAGPLNIHRWWNRGIDEAIRRGATAVAVVNDDVAIDEKTFSVLENALLSTGAAIASPSRPPFHDGLHKRRLIPYEPRLWGSLWVLRVDSGLRPDERYGWWFGDNDLDIRARRNHGGIVLCDVTFTHLHPSEQTGTDPQLRKQTEIDAQTFERQYAGLLRRSRFVTRWQQRLGLGK